MHCSVLGSKEAVMSNIDIVVGKLWIRESGHSSFSPESSNHSPISPNCLF